MSTTPSHQLSRIVELLRLAVILLAFNTLASCAPIFERILQHAR